MSVLFLILAVVIFANPYVVTVDFLPDAVGCLLVWFALKHAEPFSPELEDARKLWLRLAAITAVDAAVFYMIGTDDRVMILLLIFVFRSAEAFLICAAINRSLGGALYLGTKFDATGIYMPQPQKKQQREASREREYLEKLDRILARERERYERETEPGVSARRRRYATERYRRKTAYLTSKMHSVKHADSLSSLYACTYTFFIIRAAMCVLPEFSTIININDIKSGSVRSMSDYRMLFVEFGFVVSLGFAIWWLVRMLRYVNAIGRDKRFCSDVRAAYVEYISSHEKLYQSKRRMLAMAVLCVAAVLSLDLFLDNNNYIPDFLSAAFMIIFFIIVYPHGGRRMILGVAASAAYGVAAAVQWFSVRAYVAEYTDFTRTVVKAEARSAHVMCCVWTGLAEALFVVVMALILFEVKHIISNFTGYIRSDGTLDGASVELRENLNKQATRMFIFGVVSAVGSFFYMISLGFNRRVELSDEGFNTFTVYYPSFPQGWLLSLVVSIIFIAYTLKFISDLHDAVDDYSVM